MIEKSEDVRGQIQMTCSENLVPANHLLRKIDKAVDFNRIYGMVEHLYREDNGRPAADPVVLVKMVFIQHLFGIRSLRQTVKEIDADREAHGKKPPKDKDDDPCGGMKEAIVSDTDKDCGLFRKGEHKVEFAYTTHVACDENNFVLACETAPGNVHDSVVFDAVYDAAVRILPEADAVAVDGRTYATVPTGKRGMP
jgi:hypothetical protein